jgi:hypothetical protein
MDEATLEAMEERAAIMEYDGELSREDAEREAWAAYQAASKSESLRLGKRLRSPSRDREASKERRRHP